MKMFGVLLFVFLSLQTVFCRTGAPCAEANGGGCSCIVLTNCEYYNNTIKELGIRQASPMLKKAMCGFEGIQAKVWCPNILNPPYLATTSAPETTTLITKSGVRDSAAAFLDPPVCGLGNMTLSRIVGGLNATLDAFPWMALLGYKTRRGRAWNCGGALISERHVLTASHCIYYLEDSLEIVRLGELDYETEDDGAHPIDVPIQQMITHEDYVPSGNHDIGILILQQTISFTRSIRPICIPKGNLVNQQFEGYTPFVAGWGLTSFRGAQSSRLQFTQLTVFANDECKKAFKLHTNKDIDSKVMCVGSSEGGNDTCQGDSGGPLMQPIFADGNPYYYVTGVIAFGVGCGQAEYPGVFTRVTYYLSWIEEKILSASRDDD